MSTLLAPQPVRYSALQRRPRVTASSISPAPDAVIYMLAIAAVFATWRLQEIIPGVSALKLPVLTLLLAIGSFLSSRSTSDLARVVTSGPVKWVLVIAGLAIVGAPFGLVKSSSIIFLAFDGLPTFALCVFVAAAIRSERDARVLLTFLTLGGVVFCLYTKTHAYTDSSGRPAGIIFYDANDLALLAVTSMAVALGLAHTSRSVLMRLIWLGSVLVFLWTVLWTVSRGAFLALIAMGLYLLFSPVLPKAKRGLVIGSAALTVVIVGGQSYLKTMQSMLDPSADYNFSGKSDNGRGELWKRGLTYIAQRPLLGAGVRNYTAADGHSDLSESKAASGHGHKWSRAHNSYIEIAAEMGVPGFLAFAAVMFTTIALAHRRSRALGYAPDETARISAYLTAAMITYAFGGFFLSAEYFPLLYVLVGVSAAIGATKLRGGQSVVSVASNRLQRRNGLGPVRPVARRASASAPHQPGLAPR